MSLTGPTNIRIQIISVELWYQMYSEHATKTKKNLERFEKLTKEIKKGKMQFDIKLFIIIIIK